MRFYPTNILALIGSMIGEYYYFFKNNFPMIIIFGLIGLTNVGIIFGDGE